MAVSLPSVVGWPAMPADYLNLYDWDHIALNDSAQLSTPISLCVGLYPCVLSVNGFGVGSIELGANGSITCLSSVGCSSVRFESLDFLCTDHNFNTKMKFQGSQLYLYNSKFNTCSSSADGSILFAYDMAVVTIASCSFQNVATTGYGGVMKVAGSDISISSSNFTNCSSGDGGGAIWATAYLCTGSEDTLNTVLRIENSAFFSCSSPSSGGSILLTSDSSSSNQVSANIVSTKFEECSATLYGGALNGIGASVTITVFGSEFIHCRSRESGGAISMQSQARLQVLKSVFRENEAEGLGGGAIHSNDAFVTLIGLTGIGNIAPAGGGGVIFWEQKQDPIIALWCPQGTWGNTARSCFSHSCQLACNLCPSGTFQSSSGIVGVEGCLACLPGTFSNLSGRSECYPCPAGTYLTAAGAVSEDSCANCPLGTFSLSSSSSCSTCPAGTYTNTSGSSVCSACPSVPGAAGNLPALCYSSSPVRGSKDSKTEIPDHCYSRDLHSWSFGRESIAGGKRLQRDHRTFEPAYLKSVERPCDSPVNIKSSVSDIDPQLKIENRRLMSGRSEIALDCSSQSNPLCDLFCGLGNSALYGSCMASDYNSFFISRSSQDSAFAYAGLPVSFTAAKKDAYNQTILSDSTSVVQVESISVMFSIPSFSLVGESVFNMRNGVIQMSIIIKPFFSNVSFRKQVASLTEQPSFVLVAADSQSTINSKLQSEAFRVSIYQGERVCLPGYVLTLDDRTNIKGPGVCVFCKAGTYSLNPLAPSPGTGSLVPSCLNCPIGGNCIQGGSSVTFLVGEWESTGSLYILKSCPIGYRLINSTGGTSFGTFAHDLQQCVACLPGQYIIPNSDICQKCPSGISQNGRSHLTAPYNLTGALCSLTGAVCPDGAKFIPTVNRSTWIKTATMYFLTACPPGYQLINSTDGDSVGIFSQESQECKACSAGQYIVNPNTDTCQPCPTGACLNSMNIFMT